MITPSDAGEHLSSPGRVNTASGGDQSKPGNSTYYESSSKGKEERGGREQTQKITLSRWFLAVE